MGVCKGTLATVDNRSDIDPVVKDVCLFDLILTLTLGCLQTRHDIE